MLDNNNNREGSRHGYRRDREIRGSGFFLSLLRVRAIVATFASRAHSEALKGCALEGIFCAIA